MKSQLFACAAAVTLASVPAVAQREVRQAACEQWRHGNCVSWHGLARHNAGAAGHDVGYNFGPHPPFVEVGALPRGLASRYHLGPEFRYVSENGRVYVVNPHTYRVVRVIAVP
ncbi:MAG TPA: hypothetical protein VGU01_10440 [Sphingomicrobium sp.]|nr:hypothetical protein [Sphingomicrobium sp.]